MTAKWWPWLGLAACLVIAGCADTARTEPSAENRPGPPDKEPDRPNGQIAGRPAFPVRLVDGLELNLTGPTALRFAMDAADEESCELGLSIEFQTAGHGLSWMAVHEGDRGRGTGQSMGYQDTVVDAGPVDTRTSEEGTEGASHTTWSVNGGERTITLVVLHAEPNQSDFVTNGSVLLRSDCPEATATITAAGDQVTTWHADTLNGTAMVGHKGHGMLLDRQVHSTFNAERTIMAAFHTGDAIGQLSFVGPGVDHTATLPRDRMIMAEGGPGRYETHLDAVGGTRVWGFMAGVDMVRP